ncbi:MAG TPA: hypothetical protein VFR10_14550, partial [bacterium]|nr:hypothetical protein [bacterium]
MSRSSISRLAVLGLAVAGLLIAWKLYERGIALRTSRIGEEIQANLKQRNLPEGAPWRDRRTLALLRAFYVERNMRPAWTSGRGSKGAARDLAGVISRSDQEALDPENYGA